MAVLLTLLDNYAYEGGAPPSSSATADNMAQKIKSVLARLDWANSDILTDQLMSIAHATQYPLPQKLKSKSIKTAVECAWIDDDIIDITDWILGITIDSPKSNGTKTYNSVVCAILVWMLDQYPMPLCDFCKLHGINTTYAGILVKDYLKYIILD